MQGSYMIEEIKKQLAAADIPKLRKWFGLSTSKGISLDNDDIRDGDNVEDIENRTTPKRPFELLMMKTWLRIITERSLKFFADKSLADNIQLAQVLHYVG
ncbi:12782_t:CDS:2 [Entrophospora sp. SA101]|nr:2373_t:CDS:2 [Entrophospora sp. SA101]CAJ0640371.1 5657_t:CDS:2 [Entrophospora sp. SA101]CAJ0746237.1 5753_t:CDS:2 [Entrophospora sp. SA101]CAJ0751325.1 22373_t:CDS:2 [Entrophospora sp. SA101]CAJ0761471.1 12782_t:CDS:2 [Entrophospora sp. SA101]